jgi:hypothetical protein
LERYGIPFVSTFSIFVLSALIFTIESMTLYCLPLLVPSSEKIPERLGFCQPRRGSHLPRTARNKPFAHLPVLGYDDGIQVNH